MILDIASVTKTFVGPQRPVHALQQVDLRLEPGQVGAIQGPSGSGKTTLLLVAGGLLRPDQGTVRIRGEGLYALSSEQRAAFRSSAIGFVFQQFHLLPYLTVLDNILVPSLAGAVPGMRERALALVEQFGLGPRIAHLPSALSTGERQRVALARAMLRKPALLLADEPTGNLDDVNAALVGDAFAAFAAEGGAVLVATHDARAAQRTHCTWRMEQGRIVASATIAGAAS